MQKSLGHGTGPGAFEIRLAKSSMYGTQRTTVAVTNRAGDTVAQYPAAIVGTDATHDLAVLRIEAPAEDLQPVRRAAVVDFCCIRCDPSPHRSTSHLAASSSWLSVSVPECTCR
jgi:hypothetical protein